MLEGEKYNGGQTERQVKADAQARLYGFIRQLVCRVILASTMALFQGYGALFRIQKS